MPGPTDKAKELELLELEEEEFQHQQADRAPASPDRAPAPDQSIGKIESGLRGAVQGATFNLSDEAAGGVGAGLDTAKTIASGNVPSWDGIKAAYTKYRDKERGNNDAAQQSNPMTYLAGGLAGGLAVPGMGALASAEHLKDAGALAKIMHAAGVGSVAGGTGAFGASKADNIGDIARDTKDGAELGALVGGGLRAVPEVAKVGGRLLAKPAQAAYDTITRWQPAKFVGDSIRKGFQGTDLTNLEGQIKNLSGVADELGQEGKMAAHDISQEYNEIIKGLESSKNKVDMKPYLDKLKVLEAKARAIKSPEMHADVDDVMNTVKNYTEGMEQNVENSTTVPGQPSALDKIKSNLALEHARAVEGGADAATDVVKAQDELGRNVLIPKLTTAVDEDVSQKLFKPVVDSPAIPDALKTSVQKMRVGGSDQLTPQELFDLQKLLKPKAGFETTKLQTEPGRQFAGQANQALQDTVDSSIPELNPTDAKYKHLLRAFDSVGLDKNESFVIDPNTNKPVLRPEALQKLSTYVRQAAGNDTNSAKATRGLDLFMDNLQKAGHETTDVLRQKVADVGENVDLARQIAGKTFGGQSIFPFLNTKNAAFVGNIAGQATKAISEKTAPAVFTPALASAMVNRTPPSRLNDQGIQRDAKTGGNDSDQEVSAPTAKNDDINNTCTTDLSREVYNLQDHDLEEVGHLMVAQGQTGQGNSLLQAIQSGDKKRKDAMLFAILQNPKARAILRGEGALMPVKRGP